MAKTFKIDPEAAEVLKRATIGSDRVVLPDQRLDRKLYDRINKILVGAGGKWSKREKAHLFQSDPRQTLGRSLETGLGANLQQINQTFFTPPDIARRMVEKASWHTGFSVLEPSAGTGRLIEAVIRKCKPSNLFAVEKNDQLAQQLKEKFAGDSRVTIYHDDFLQLKSPGQFDRVIMNPPFDKGADIKHIRHAMSFLRPGGRLISICGNGPKQAREFLDGAAEWEELPAGTFEGTRVKTVILVLDAV